MKLSYKDRAAAMAVMDTDGSGTIEFEEFEQWWSTNVDAAQPGEL